MRLPGHIHVYLMTCVIDYQLLGKAFCLNQYLIMSWQEKRLCSEIRLPPHIYLKMQEVITVEICSGNVSKKSDAHNLFKIEPGKIDRVYDMLVKKGIALP